MVECTLALDLANFSRHHVKFMDLVVAHLNMLLEKVLGILVDPTCSLIRRLKHGIKS